MAVLRHAARRLCERALQRSHRGRLPMSTSSSIKSKREPTAEEMEKRIEKSREELRKLFEDSNRDRNGRTILRKSESRDYGTTARIGVFGAFPLFLGSIYCTQER